tara:strand:+ start:4323 stop:5036 length:714 start_codon:yes stop_codon:yes gene_type:complete
MALPKVALPTYELELPSNGKNIKYRPFVVKEEKLLLMAMDTEEEAAITSAVKELLKNCVQSRIKIDQLPTFDLEYLFLNIRAVSVGEEVDMTITCKDDNKTEVKYTFSLFDVKIDKPEGHDPKIKLSDDLGIIFRYPTFPEFVKSSIIGKQLDPEGYIDVIAGCVDQIYDGEEVYDSSTTSKKEFKEFIEGLTTNQFKDITKFFDTIPKLEHRFNIKNPETGVESEYVINGLQNFFG